MTSENNNPKPSEELLQEFIHQQLIDLLIQVYKVAGIPIERMDKAIAEIEALIAKQEARARIDELKSLDLRDGRLFRVKERIAELEQAGE